MGLLRRIQSKISVLLIALLMSVFLFAGWNFLQVSAVGDTNEITYIDTEVKNIAFVQHPSRVFFGFELTESDYDDFGLMEGDFGGTDVYTTYEKYMALDLTYWKNFSQMNSEKVIFDQIYAYWNGSAVGPARFANTVAHRSTLALLEYGFVISIPAGTTFPSLTYVAGNCQGTPIMYKTTEDKAFYYDGNSFAEMSYSIAKLRSDAEKEVDSINYNLYHSEERKQVKELVEAAKAQIKLSFSSFAVQDVLSQFYSDVNKIMTKEDYVLLASQKTAAKTLLATFFDGLSASDYDTEDWQTVLSIKNDSNQVIDSCASKEDIDGVVTGVKFAVGNILKKDEKLAFAEYRAAAIQRLNDAFVETLYRDAERAQGAAFLQEGTQFLAQATTYGEVDAVESSYRAKISSLKTQAQWEEEEFKQEEENVSKEEKSSSEEETPQESGCSSTANGVLVIFSLVFAVMLMIINRKRTDCKDEK